MAKKKNNEPENILSKANLAAKNARHFLRRPDKVLRRLLKEGSLNQAIQWAADHNCTESLHHLAQENTKVGARAHEAVYNESSVA